MVDAWPTHRSYFWMVLSSTPPVRYRIWPPMVDLPASTCPMNTTFKWSLREASTPADVSHVHAAVTVHRRHVLPPQPNRV